MESVDESLADDAERSYAHGQYTIPISILGVEGLQVPKSKFFRLVSTSDTECDLCWEISDSPDDALWYFKLPDSNYYDSTCIEHADFEMLTVIASVASSLWRIEAGKIDSFVGPVPTGAELELHKMATLQAERWMQVAQRAADLDK